MATLWADTLGALSEPAVETKDLATAAERQRLWCVAVGESAIKCPSPLRVLKYSHDHSCY
jgi:hypothetical protein